MAFIRGNFLSNHLTGTDADDILAGLGGDDILDGGRGRDTAWYGGVLAGYQFARSEDRLVVKDINPADGTDGTDSLSGIETLQFNGIQIHVGPVDMQVNSFFSGDQVTPSIAALHDGGYVVSWSSSGQDGSGPGVFAQRYGGNGFIAGGELPVNAATLGNQSAPSVASLANGGFVTAWQSFFFGDGDGWAVVVQRYDASGNKVGMETQVNIFAASDQFDPQVAGLIDGGFVVAWTSDSQDGSGNGIYAERYAANGETTGCEFRVNATTSNDQSDASIAALQTRESIPCWPP